MEQPCYGPSSCLLSAAGRNDSGEENVPLDLTRGKQRLLHITLKAIIVQNGCGAFLQTLAPSSELPVGRGSFPRIAVVIPTMFPTQFRPITLFAVSR